MGQISHASPDSRTKIRYPFDVYLRSEIVGRQTTGTVNQRKQKGILCWTTRKRLLSFLKNVETRCLKTKFCIQVIGGAGHHVYADKTDEFHRLVLSACKTVDNSQEVVEVMTIDKKPTAEEELVHERQTDISHSVLGAMQATETLETPWICRICGRLGLQYHPLGNFVYIISVSKSCVLHGCVPIVWIRSKEIENPLFNKKRITESLFWMWILLLLYNVSNLVKMRFTVF